MSPDWDLAVGGRIFACAGLPSLLEIDAGVVRWSGGERHFLNVAGTGFDSEVTETANRMRTRIQGSAKYVAAVLKTLPGFQPGRFEVTVDGEHHTLPGMMIAVGNGVSYGGGMKITPGASFTDGQLDMTVIGAMPKPQFLWNFPKVFRGTHVRHPKYGRGLVLRREGAGDSVKLLVSFPGFGQKKLIEKYAGLEKA